MTAQQLEKVMAPKVMGAWHLHQQTLNMPLDFFVMFSSVTSVIGNPGQGNYAAANAFLDALAHYRHHMGLPALTINWGAISDTGYAAKDSDVAKHLDRIGVKGFTTKQAFDILKRLLDPSSGAVQVVVAHMDWQKWSQSHAAGKSPRYSYLIAGTGGQKDDGKKENESDFLSQLKKMPTEEQEKQIHDFVCMQVSQVLGRDPAKSLDPDKGFFELGMDSMMTMELRNRLMNQLNLTLPTTLAFKYPNIKSLVGYLVQEILALHISSDTSALAESVQDELEIPDAAIIAEVENLSEDEAEMSLLDELERLESGIS
jgi:acyl carrier protein